MVKDVTARSAGAFGVQIFWRDVIDQPDAVLGTGEGEAICTHARGVNHQHDRLAVTAADLESSFCVG